MFSASKSRFASGWFTCTELVQDNEKMEEIARNLVPILANIRSDLDVARTGEEARVSERARRRGRVRGREGEKERAIEFERERVYVRESECV